MSFWRRASVLIGAITTSVPLWPYIRKALEWGEHGEFILHRVHDIKGIGPVLETLLTPALWQPLVLTPLGLLVLWLALRRGSGKAKRRAEGAENAVQKAELPDAVQIEFKWNPGNGSASEPFEINAIITAKQNLKNFALIGHFATDRHYLSGVEWIWEPSIRLLKLDDIFKGEVKTVPIIRCPRSGDAMTVFNERVWGLKSDGVLILLRATAVSDSSEQFVQKAYQARQFGQQNDFQPISLDDISYITGVENPVVRHAASATHQPVPSVATGISAVAPTPDIDPRAAYFQILENSTWSENELKIRTDTKNLRRDWLEVTLDREIHKALRNSRLSAWGEESLPGLATTPEKPIPPEVWDKVEISFNRDSLPRCAAYFKGPTSLQLGPMAWVGVKFSKDQIFGLFPLTGTKPSTDRIPITELLKIATGRGWNFTDQHSLQLIDLQDAIRQGGLDGHLTVSGKLNRWPRAEQLMRKEVIEKNTG